MAPEEKVMRNEVEKKHVHNPGNVYGEQCEPSPTFETVREKITINRT
jgi:hypothetical protein